MSSILIEDDRFPDIIIQFIMDYMMSEDLIPDNEEWKNVVKKMENGGLKPIFLKYYLNINAVNKSKYKTIKNIFHDKSKKETINIVNRIPNKPKTKTKGKGVSTIIKKVLKVIKSHKDRNHGMPLHEETIDQIIAKVLRESDIKGDIL